LPASSPADRGGAGEVARVREARKHEQRADAHHPGLERVIERHRHRGAEQVAEAVEGVEVPLGGARSRRRRGPARTRPANAIGSGSWLRSSSVVPASTSTLSFYPALAACEEVTSAKASRPMKPALVRLIARFLCPACVLMAASCVAGYAM
jgi:hypothetical protein